MRIRETPQRIRIVNMQTGAEAPSVYEYGKYEDVIKRVVKSNTLVSRFPNKWMAY